jgi:hypothetical protein
LVVVGSGKGGQNLGRFNFLKENQVRLAVSDDGVEAAQVCPLVCVEAYDREERGHGLSILPRERRIAL